MAEISVEIDGRKYRLGCEDGQEAHVRGLAQKFSGYVEGLRGEFGEAGDVRLTVMAALTVMDDLHAMAQDLTQAKSALDQLAIKSNKLVEERDAMQKEFTTQLNLLADRVETLTKQLAHENINAP